MHVFATIAQPPEEALFGLNKIRREIPSKPSYHTMRRWCNEGLQVGPDLVFLECFRIGRSILTSHAAVERFAQRTQLR